MEYFFLFNYQLQCYQIDISRWLNYFSEFSIFSQAIHINFIGLLPFFPCQIFENDCIKASYRGHFWSELWFEVFNKLTAILELMVSPKLLVLVYHPLLLFSFSYLNSLSLFPNGDCFLYFLFFEQELKFVIEFDCFKRRGVVLFCWFILMF